MEWVETTARTVAEAQEAALDRLGVAADDAEFEVIEEPRSGLFGRVRGEARVRARIKPTPVRPKQERRRRGKTEGGKTEGGSAGAGTSQGATAASIIDEDGPDDDDRPERPTPTERSRRNSRNGRGGGGGRSATASGERKQTGQQQTGQQQTGQQQTGQQQTGQQRTGRDSSSSDESAGETSSDDSSDRAARRQREERPMNDQYDNDDRDDRPSVPPEDVGRAAVAFMDGLVDAFGASGTSSLTVDGIELEVNVTGSDLGRLVGPGGRTLNAVQDLARVAAQRRLGDHETRLRIDVGGYRQRRQEALAKFARSVADAVLESGEPRSMEPMTSADRKVVHDVLAEVDGVTSRSEGDDPNRRVVVVPA